MAWFYLSGRGVQRRKSAQNKQLSSPMRRTSTAMFHQVSAKMIREQQVKLSPTAPHLSLRR